MPGERSVTRTAAAAVLERDRPEVGRAGAEERRQPDRPDGRRARVGDRQAEVGRVVGRGLLQVAQEQRPPGPARPGLGAVRLGRLGRGDVAGREGVVGRVVVVHRQPDLLQVVRALHPSGRLAGGLHGGQEQGDQHGDDRDHHQQLDQGEGASGARRRGAWSDSRSEGIDRRREGFAMRHRRSGSRSEPDGRASVDQFRKTWSRQSLRSVGAGGGTWSADSPDRPAGRRDAEVEAGQGERGRRGTTASRASSSGRPARMMRVAQAVAGRVDRVDRAGPGQLGQGGGQRLGRLGLADQAGERQGAEAGQDDRSGHRFPLGTESL